MKTLSLLQSPLLLGSIVTVLGLFSSFAEMVESTVKSVKGTVEFAAPGSTSFAPVTVGQKLASGTQIRTGAGSEAIITVTSGSAVRVDEKTSFTLSDMEFAKTDGKVTKRKATIDLTDGTISALIDHNNPEATDFRIKTPQGIAAARGTFYGVSVSKGNTFVKVAEGKVGFKKPKKDKAKPATASDPIKSGADKKV